MASAVGAKAISLRQAVIIAGILNFLGAILVGSHVTETVSSGILDANLIDNVQLLLYGLFAALCAAGIWITITTFIGAPISTTHSVIGALVGVGLVINTKNSYPE